MCKQTPPAPTASAVGPCPTVIQIVGRPGPGSLPGTIAPPDHPNVGEGGGLEGRWVHYERLCAMEPPARIDPVRNRYVNKPAEPGLLCTTVKYRINWKKKNETAKTWRF